VNTTNLVASPFAGAAEARGVTAASRATQSREVAETQVKFLMAQQFPRDERRAMDGILNAFARPGLAERAQYAYAKGGTDITGLSIHAAQAIAQQWGNLEAGWTEVSRGVGADGVPFSEVRAYATDLQTRVPRQIQFIARHWRDTKSGGYALKDERDLYELCANMAQRRVRACILSIIPQDVLDAAEEQATATLKTKADTSPEAMAKMLAAFLPFGVRKEHVEALIQRRLDSITPAQVVRLKRIYASLRDQMSEAGDWFDLGATAEGGAPPPPPAGSSIEKVTRAARKTAAAPPPAGEAAAPPPPPADAKPDGDGVLQGAASEADADLARGAGGAEGAQS
jgi:hypothetical protein